MKSQWFWISTETRRHTPQNAGNCDGGRNNQDCADNIVGSGKLHATDLVKVLGHPEGKSTKPECVSGVPENGSGVREVRRKTAQCGHERYSGDRLSVLFHDSPRWIGNSQRQQR